MSKATFEINDEILEFVFHKKNPDGRGGEIELDGNAIEYFIQNCNNFYPSDSIGIIKDVILEVSLTWENGRTNKWGIVVRLDSDAKMIKPEINYIGREEIEGQDIVKIYIKVKGNFFYKFSPTKNLIDQHKDWPNSSLELKFNFRSNFKKPNNVDFGNIYCDLKYFQNRKNFHTDFI